MNLLYYRIYPTSYGHEELGRAKDRLVVPNRFQKDLLTMNLYYIDAYDHALWVRAANEERAFDLWCQYYDMFSGGTLHTAPTGTYSIEEAESEYSYEIELRKTYAEPAPVEGAISTLR